MTLPLSYSRLRVTDFAAPLRRRQARFALPTSAAARRRASRFAHNLLIRAAFAINLAGPGPELPSPNVACQPELAERAKVGGEGRTRTFEAARATDLQSAAFDRFATSPAVCVFGEMLFP